MNTHAHRRPSDPIGNDAGVKKRGLAVVVVDLERPRSAANALQRASELVDTVDLHVVGRIAAQRPISASHRARLRDLLYETTAPLPDHVAIDAEIRIGDRYSVAVEIASEHRPTLLVIGSSRSMGANLVAIADALAIPVLIARAPKRSGRVVAASDARLELTPVLGAAQRILGANCGPITLFHAATPACRHVRYESPSGDGLTFDPATCERLLALQHLVPDNSNVRVDAAEDPVHAILDFSERRDVDVLVIGYRQRPSLGYVRNHTTARIIDGSDCSVMIVPISRGADA